jgi:hypothetical protein
MSFGFAAAPAPFGFTGAGTFAAAGAPQPAAAPNIAGTGTFGGGSLTGQASQQPTGANTAAGNVATTPLTPTITVPPYDELFPNQSIWNKITDLLHVLSASTSGTEEASLAGQDLIDILSRSDQTNSIAYQLLHQRSPTGILEAIAPDHALRQRLEQNPSVNLSVEQDDGSFSLQEATITHSMLTDICLIADDLQISEVAAISLFQQAASSKTPFRSKFVRSCLQSSNSVNEAPELSLSWMAREIYAAQSPLLLRACLALLQHRLREGNSVRSQNPVTEATDALFSSGWIHNLIQLVLNHSTHSNNLMAAINTPSAQRQFQESSSFWRYDMALQLCYRERLLAAECIFFATYNLQMMEDEVIALVDLLRSLTNASRVLNPYTDVPDPFESLSAGSYDFAGTPWGVVTDQQIREKDPLEWQQQLAIGAWQTGQPQLLRCACIVLMANISALSDRATLIDRSTHLPNHFGLVSPFICALLFAFHLASNFLVFVSGKRFISTGVHCRAKRYSQCALCGRSAVVGPSRSFRTLSGIVCLTSQHLTMRSHFSSSLWITSRRKRRCYQKDFSRMLQSSSGTQVFYLRSSGGYSGTPDTRTSGY